MESHQKCLIVNYRNYEHLYKMSSRLDLSEWLIHFVHRKNPANEQIKYTYNEEIADLEEEVLYLPDSFDSIGKPIYKTIRYEEEHFELAPDEHPYEILQKILTNGYVKTGWSFRRGKPTIYGPYSASCYTEMPLYALLEYSKQRNSEYNVQAYGIAFLRSEMFGYGARPVIYGLTKPFSEADNPEDSYYAKGLRCLSESCGIGLHEQYRYVSTNLTFSKRIDWTHEREWRWADTNNRYQVPGLPFYLNDYSTNFSKIIVIVNDDFEADDTINFLKTLHHAARDPFGRNYKLKIIENTFVLSLESLNRLGLLESNIKLDDLPLKSLPVIKDIIASPETLKLVSQIWNEACQISLNESERIYKGGGFNGMSAFVNISTNVSHSEITQAFIDLKIAHGYAGKYLLYGLRTVESMNSIGVEYPAAKLAAEYLTQKLNQNFSVDYRWD